MLENGADLILLIKFILLGFVQGFTEPIPISSSGHVILIKDLFGIYTTGLSFEIIVNFGSLLAIMTVYRNDLIVLIKENIAFLFKGEKQYAHSFRFTLYLLLATMITGVLGLTIEQFISEELTKPLFVGISLLVTAFFVWLIRNLQGTKSDIDITMKDAIIIGLAQTCALIPGISRSGATIVAAMLIGLKRETALRFSFLLFIPVTIGVNVLSYKDIVNDPLFSANFIPYTLAFITSIITTYFALKWFIDVMKKGKLIIFTYYCLVVGTAVIVYQLFFN
ncbi:undecaprenyl-diphosphate phosphatase [Pseudogracilibacillus auburnensis]|uniref:undecaprenyl-diphosphate phosphatase n=1 Tax=Pseudogracilibacillus auburnensis TaxID=1494959 RepID=UPI0027DA4220|nr:undecaprenyl-diphosphate phosphatase [Pseudogracilibacillus auburnensis]